jgi:hypothetical protein
MTAPETSPSTVVDLPRRPGKPRGYPKPPNSGRKPGVRNRRSLEVEALFRPLVPATKRRLRAIIDDPKSDPDTVVRCAALLLGYIYGRPTERRELTGKDGAPLGPPPRGLTPEEAMRTAEAVATILDERRKSP